MARTADEGAGFLMPGSFESFRVDLGLNYTQASVVLVLGAPGAILGNVFVVLADHRSRRAIAAGGAFGYAAALVTFGLAPGVAALAGASFVMGVAATAMVHGTEIALVDLVGDDVTAFFARGMVFGAAGGVVGPAALVLAAAAGLGWRVAFLACAPLLVAYGVWLTRLPFPHPRRPDPAGRVVRSLAPIARDARVWYCGLLALLLGPLQQPLTAFVISYLERVRGASTTLAPAIQIAWIAGSVTTAAFASRSGHRTGPRTMAVNAVLLLISALGAALVPSIPAVGACVALNGVALTRFMLALKTRVASLHPDRLGSVSAMVTTLEFIGFVLPLGAGVLADSFGLTTGMLFYAADAAILVGAVGFGARYFRSSRAI